VGSVPFTKQQQLLLLDNNVFYLLNVFFMRLFAQHAAQQNISFYPIKTVCISGADKSERQEVSACLNLTFYLYSLLVRHKTPSLFTNAFLHIFSTSRVIHFVNQLSVPPAKPRGRRKGMEHRASSYLSAATYLICIELFWLEKHRSQTFKFKWWWCESKTIQI